MQPDVSEIDSPFVYKIRINHRATLLRKITYRNSKNAHTRYKKEYEKHVRSEQSSVADDYVFGECTPLMAFAEDRLEIEG